MLWNIVKKWAKSSVFVKNWVTWSRPSATRISRIVSRKNDHRFCDFVGQLCERKYTNFQDFVSFVCVFQSQLFTVPSRLIHLWRSLFPERNYCFVNVFSNEIIENSIKTHFLLLTKQTEFLCILSEKLTDLVGLGSNGKAKTFELFSFNFDHIFLKFW